MADDYADLNLDDILEIALADKNNSAEINNQADAVSSLASVLEDTVRASIEAQAHIDGNMSISQRDPAEDAALVTVPVAIAIFAAMESMSTNATSLQTKALIENGKTNLPALQPQVAAFQQIANETTNVYNALDGMRTERNEHIGLFSTDPKNSALAKYAIPEDATPDEAAKRIREYHDERARTRMADSATMYVRVVDELPMPTPYEGPRIPRPEPPPTDSGNPGGNGVVTRVGPPLTRDQPPIGDPPPPPPPPPPPHTGVPPIGERPDLQGPGAPPPPPAIGQPLPTPVPPPVGTGPGPVPPPPSVFVPNRPVTPPVIGNRGGPSPSGRSPFTPNRTGLNRPVIGERPGKTNPVAPPRGSSQSGRGNTPPRGSSQSGRGAMPPGRGGSGRAMPPPPGRNAGGKSVGQGGRAPGRPMPPPGTDGRTPRAGTPAPRTPGVRSQPSQKPATGPVRGRPVPGQRYNATQPTRITRAPKMHHGGNDVNRPVIGRSQKAKKYRDDEQPTTSQQQQENQWFDVSGTTPPVIGRKSDRAQEHDPGDYITNRNLGRRDWSGD